MNVFQAERIARAFLLYLKPAIEFSLICGSIRRREPSVNDAEIVAVPKMGPAVGVLFDAGELESKLDAQLERLIAGKYVSFDPSLNRKGPRYKRLLKDGLPIDLYIVTPPVQLGWIIAVRTGPESFSKQLVTPRESGGFLPLDAKIVDGRLYRKGIPIPTPTEESFFEAMGMRYVEPQHRHSYSPFAKGARTFSR